MNTRLLRCITRANPAMRKLKLELDTIPAIQSVANGISVLTTKTWARNDKDVPYHPNVQLALHWLNTNIIQLPDRIEVEPLLEALLRRKNCGGCNFARLRDESPTQ